MWKEEFQFKLDDLKQENLQLKKQINELTSINSFCKVKIRKLEVQCSKKDKEILFLIDPKNSKIFQQHISENGASLVMRIKKENAKLQNLVLERDILINRLSSELKATNIYTPPEKRKLEVDMHNKETTETPYYNCSENEKGLSCNSTDSESYVTSIAEHLQKHKQQSCNEIVSLDLIIKSLQCKELEKLYSNLEQIKKSCNINVINEEILELQNYFMEMLTEVDDLKLLINEHQKEQEKTSDVLNQGNNIHNIAEKLKNKPPNKDSNKKPIKIKRKKSSNTKYIKMPNYQNKSKSETLLVNTESDSVGKSDFNLYYNYVEVPKNPTLLESNAFQ